MGVGIGKKNLSRIRTPRHVPVVAEAVSFGHSALSGKQLYKYYTNTL